MSLYWAGVDCASFVQRVINASDPVANSLLTDLSHVDTKVFKLADKLGDYRLTCGMEAGIRKINNPRAWVEYFFEGSMRRTYADRLPQTGGGRVDRLKLLHKGDLLQYPRSSNGPSHITILSSDNILCGDSNSATSCNYRITHAFGSTPYSYPESPGVEVFSRKVINTWQDIGIDPLGFGRVKLWD